MASNNKYVSENMNGNILTNVSDPVNDQDAATKKYVDDNAGGGAILEWREFVIPSNSSLDHEEAVVLIPALPAGYYKAELHTRAIGTTIVGTKTEVLSLDIVQTVGAASLMANEKPLFYPSVGAENLGDRYMTFFFNKTSPGTLDYNLVFQMVDPLKNVLLAAGGKLVLYRMVDPVAAWT